MRIMGLLILVWGCASHSPRQLGGLAVFNPKGVETRVAWRVGLQAMTRTERPMSRAKVESAAPAPFDRTRHGEAAEE